METIRVSEANKPNVVNFVAKVYDKVLNEWVPIYTPPIGTETERGTVFLTDNVLVDGDEGYDENSNYDAKNGKTAVTPKGLENLYNKIVENVDIGDKVDSHEKDTKRSGVYGTAYDGTTETFKDQLLKIVKSEKDLNRYLEQEEEAGNPNIGTLKETIIPSVQYFGDFNSSWLTNEGTIALDRIPQAAMERFVPVENKNVMMSGLTKDNAQNGDVVKDNTTGIMYIVVDDTKLGNGTMEAFQEYKAGTAAKAESVDWSGITNKPSNATSSSDGFMSSADKARLDSIKFGYTTNGKKYRVIQDKKTGNLYVEVPWTDHDTWKPNSVTDDGYVTKSSATNVNKVWKTNDKGVPGWRADANTTYGNATSSTKGIVSVGDRLSVSNGKISANWQVFGGRNEPNTDTTRKHCIYVKYDA